MAVGHAMAMLHAISSLHLSHLPIPSLPTSPTFSFMYLYPQLIHLRRKLPLSGLAAAPRTCGTQQQHGRKEILPPLSLSLSIY